MRTSEYWDFVLHKARFSVYPSDSVEVPRYKAVKLLAPAISFLPLLPYHSRLSEQIGEMKAYNT